MIFRKKYIFGLVIISGLTFIGVNSFTKHQNKSDNIKVYNKYEIKENEYGQSYGSNLANTEYGNEPYLILVETDDGKLGYAYKDDFYDTKNQPNNPEEAVAYTEMVEKNIKKKGYYRAIPVYENDGKTKIGSFKIGG